MTFPLGQAIEVDDPAIIAKAKTAHSIFKVEDGPPRPEPAPAPAPAPDDDGDNGDNGDNGDDEEDERPHQAVPRRPAVTHHATRKKK